MRSDKAKRILKDFILMTVGTTIVSLGAHWFRLPNNFVIGGVSGVALIIHRLTNIANPDFWLNLLNVVLLIIGLLILGRDFGSKSLYCSILFSAELWLFQLFIPMKQPFTNQPLLELMFCIAMSGIGTAMLYQIGATTGGTDIIAVILAKYTKMNIGRGLLIANFLAAALSLAIFNIEVGLFSLLGLVLNTFIVDLAVDNINMCKYFTIVTSYPDEICKYIIEELHHGATKLDSFGAFTSESKTVILTACPRRQAVWLRIKIKEIDPHAFLFITNTSEIVGKGFQQ